ncbi:hypothetical protein MPSEU_000458500 [Mayamaea pseudoterrestris]|nr:hypothetical protein MPSEU_000458500 [Mayamaea pseudoterrestris]
MAELYSSATTMGNQVSTTGSSLSTPTTVTSSHGQDNNTQQEQQEASCVLDIPGFPRAEAFLQVAIQQFHQSMAAFPSQLSKDYYETTKSERSLVLQMETPEILFLQCENFNPWSASWRCIKYWNQRKKTFGDKAYYPMLQGSHKGALQQVDIDILKSGALAIGMFEPVNGDSSNGQVICVDTHKLRFYQDLDAGVATARCMFYLLTICMEAAENFEGEVTFVVFTDNDVDECVVELKKWQEMVLQVFPITRATVHVAPCDLSTQKHQNASGSKHYDDLQVDWQVHSNESHEQLFASLRKLGLPSYLMPERIGGTGLRERALHWHQERASIEFHKYGPAYAPLASASSEASHSTGSVSTRHHEVSSSDSGRAPVKSSSNTKVSSSKQDVASKKRKAQLLDLPLETDDLDRQEYIRKRNAAYSKRKYHRKKIEIEVLKKQTTDMQQQNDKLRSEGSRLEEMLQMIKARVALVEAQKAMEPQVRVEQMSPADTFIHNHRRLDSMSLPPAHMDLSQQQQQQRNVLPSQVNVGAGWSRASEPLAPQNMYQEQPQQKLMQRAVPQSILVSTGYVNNPDSSSRQAPPLQIPFMSSLMSAAATNAPSPGQYTQSNAAPIAQLYSDLLSGRAQVPSHGGVALMPSAPAAAPTHAPVPASIQFQRDPQQQQQYSMGESSVPAWQGGLNHADPVTQLLAQLLQARQSGGQGF